VLAPPERRELKRRAQKRSLAVELVKRAEAILMLAAGHSYREVRQRLDCSDEYIREWKKRFQEERLAGLDSRYRGSPRRTRTAETEARILELTRQGPKDGTTHWSSYRLAKELGISQSSVSRVWRHFGIQPHRLRSYMASDDPEFEEKAADIIGLYLKPPVNAAVFCVDEKSAIQALDRLDPVLPVDFLDQIVASQPDGREIHIVADNLSAHKTKHVFEFLQANPTVRIHYTPTYSSWLNQVEIWFSKIQRDVIARGIFTSTTDLSRKLIRYIKQYNRTATPFRWKYKNADHRIKPITQRGSDSLH
jgi:transposase